MPELIENRIRGTLREAIIAEFLSNSFHFPLANILIELILEGPGHYLLSLDFMASLLAPAVQATLLGRWKFQGKPRPLLGNLAGPLIYTVIDLSATPGEFFTLPFHYAYWVFALTIGIIQELRLRFPDTALNMSILLENMVRSGILIVMYWFIEQLTEPKYASFQIFMLNKSHIFICLAIVFLSLIVGMENARSQKFLQLLRKTADQLSIFSRWLLGRNMLSQAISDPSALSLIRRNRAVLFIDIRGFTEWSERQSPETVVTMLNQYYEIAEAVLVESTAIQFKYTADEVMAFFPGGGEALQVALRLQRTLGETLGEYGLTAGIGVHYGPVVEGLFGSSELKRYDIIGDTVNTAKRICSAAAGGELLVSADLPGMTTGAVSIQACREIQAKGKSLPLRVCLVQAA